MKRYIVNKTLKMKPTDSTTSLNKKTETVKTKREDAAATHNSPKEKLHPKKQRANRYKAESRQQSAEAKTHHDRHPQPHAVITKNVYPYMKISLQIQPSRSETDADSSPAPDLNDNSETDDSASSYSYSDYPPQLRESPQALNANLGRSSNDSGPSTTLIYTDTTTIQEVTILEVENSLRSTTLAENVISTQHSDNIDAVNKIYSNDLEKDANKNVKDLIDDISRDLCSVIQLSAPPKTPEHFREIDEFNCFLATLNQGIPDLKTNPNEPENFSQHDIFNGHLAAKNRESAEEAPQVADQPTPNLLLTHAYDGSAYTALPTQQMQPLEVPLKCNQLETYQPNLVGASYYQPERLVKDDGVDFIKYRQPLYTTGKNYGQFVADTPRVMLAQSTRIPPQALSNATGFFVETVYNGIHHAKYYELPWLSEAQASYDYNFKATNIGEPHYHQQQFKNYRTYGKTPQYTDRLQYAIHTTPREKFLDEVDGSVGGYTQTENLCQHMGKLKQKQIYQNHAYQTADAAINISTTALRPYAPPITAQSTTPTATYVRQQHTSSATYDDTSATTEMSYGPLGITTIAQRNNATPIAAFCPYDERVSKIPPSRAMLLFADVRTRSPTDASYAPQEFTEQAQRGFIMPGATYTPQEEKLFKIPPNPASISFYSDFRSTWPVEQSYAPQAATVQAQRDFIMPNTTYGPQQGTVIEIAANPNSAPQYAAKVSSDYGCKSLYSTMLAEGPYVLKRPTVTVQRENMMPTAMYGPQQEASFIAAPDYVKTASYADMGLKMEAEKCFEPSELPAEPSAYTNVNLADKCYDLPEKTPPKSVTATNATDHIATSATKPSTIFKPPKKVYIERFALGHPTDESAEINKNSDDAVETGQNNPNSYNCIETAEIHPNSSATIEVSSKGSSIGNIDEIHSNVTTALYSNNGDDSAVIDQTGYAPDKITPPVLDETSIAVKTNRNTFTDNEVQDLAPSTQPSVAPKEILPPIAYREVFSDTDKINANDILRNILDTENTSTQVPPVIKHNYDPPKTVSSSENRSDLTLRAEGSVHAQASVQQCSESPSHKESIQQVQLPRLIVSIPKSRVKILSSIINARNDGNPIVGTSEVTPYQLDKVRQNKVTEEDKRHLVDKRSDAPVAEIISSTNQSNEETPSLTNHKAKILSCIINGTEDGSHLIKNFTDRLTEATTHSNQLNNTKRSVLENNAEEQDELHKDGPVVQEVTKSVGEFDDTSYSESRIIVSTHDENQSTDEPSGIWNTRSGNDDESDLEPENLCYGIIDIEDVNKLIEDHSQEPSGILAYINEFDDISDTELENTTDTIIYVINVTEEEDRTIDEPSEILPAHNENAHISDSQPQDATDVITRSTDDIEDINESIYHHNQKPSKILTYINEFEDISDSEEENTADTIIRVINGREEEGETIDEPSRNFPACNDNGDISGSQPQDSAHDMTKTINDIEDINVSIYDHSQASSRLLTYINEFDDTSDSELENTTDTIIRVIHTTEEDDRRIDDATGILPAHSENGDSAPQESAAVFSRSINDIESYNESIDDHNEEQIEILAYINDFDDRSDLELENATNTISPVINGGEDGNRTIDVPAGILVAHNENDEIGDSEPQDFMSGSMNNNEDVTESIGEHSEEPLEILRYINEFDDISDSELENTTDTVIHIVSTTEDDNRTVEDQNDEPAEEVSGQNDFSATSGSVGEHTAEMLSRMEDRTAGTTENDNRTVEDQNDEPAEEVSEQNNFSQTTGSVGQHFAEMLSKEAGTPSIDKQYDESVELMISLNVLDSSSSLETQNETVLLKRAIMEREDDNQTIDDVHEELAAVLACNNELNATVESVQNSNAEMLKYTKNPAKDDISPIEIQNDPSACRTTDSTIQSTRNDNNFGENTESVPRCETNVLDRSESRTYDEASLPENKDDELSLSNRNDAIYSCYVEPSVTLTSLNELDDKSYSQPQCIANETRKTPLAEYQNVDDDNDESHRKTTGNDRSSMVTQPTHDDFCCTTESIPKSTGDLLKNIKTESDELADGDGTQSAEDLYHNPSGNYEDISEDDLSDSESQNNDDTSSRAIDGMEDECQATEIESEPNFEIESEPSHAKDIRTDFQRSQTANTIIYTLQSDTIGSLPKSYANIVNGIVNETNDKISSIEKQPNVLKEKAANQASYKPSAIFDCINEDKDNSKEVSCIPSQNQWAENLSNELRGALANPHEIEKAAEPVQRTTSEILSSIMDFIQYKSFETQRDEPSDAFYCRSKTVPPKPGIKETRHNSQSLENIEEESDGDSEFNDSAESVPKATAYRRNRHINEIKYGSLSIQTDELPKAHRNEPIKDDENVPLKISNRNNEFDEEHKEDEEEDENQSIEKLRSKVAGVEDKQSIDDHTEKPPELSTDFNEYDDKRDSKPQNTTPDENQWTNVDNTNKSVSTDDANQTTGNCNSEMAAPAFDSCICSQTQQIRTFVTKSGKKEKTQELQLTLHEEKCPDYRSVKNPFVEVKLSQLRGRVGVKDYNEAKGYIHCTNYQLFSPILLFKIVTTRIDATIENLRSGKANFVGHIANFQEFVSDTASGVLKVDTKRIKALYIHDNGVLGLVAGTIYPGEYVILYTIAYLTLTKLRKLLDSYFSTTKITENADEETNSMGCRGPSEIARKKRLCFTKQLLEYLCFESRKSDFELGSRSDYSTSTIFPDIDFTLNQPQKVWVDPESAPEDSIKYFKGMSSNNPQKESEPEEAPYKSQEASAYKMKSKRRRFDALDDYDQVVKKFCIFRAKDNKQGKDTQNGAGESKQLISDQQNVSIISDGHMATQTSRNATDSTQALNSGADNLDFQSGDVNILLRTMDPSTQRSDIKENHTTPVNALKCKRSATDDGYAPPKKKSRFFQCEKCSAAFLQKSILEVHQLQHNKGMSHECLICEQRFRKETELVRHLRLHRAIRTYKCASCPTTLVDPFVLNNHCKNQPGLELHPCCLCKETFVTKSILRLHLASHAS